MDFNYHFEGEEEIISPALVYYREVIEENIKKAVALAGNQDGAKRLWPHVKTFKNSFIVRMLMAHGIKRFKCATIAEAEMCAGCGAENILISYPLVGPNINRFVELQKQYPSSHFWAMGDDISALKSLGSAAKKSGFCVPFLADVNTGMNRTGVVFEKLVEFSKDAAKIDGLDLKGLHYYDGHLGIKNISEREKAAADETEKLDAVLRELDAIGINFSVLIMGGTPTFPVHAKRDNVFLSPGTIFLNDQGYADKYADLSFVPGAAILTRVVSHPKEGLFTIDLGYKGISPDQGERGVIADFPRDVIKALGQSEEHWVFESASRPPIGTVLYVIPHHICPTNALYPGFYVVENRKLKDFYETEARDRKITI